MGFWGVNGRQRVDALCVPYYAPVHLRFTRCSGIGGGAIRIGGVRRSTGGATLLCSVRVSRYATPWGVGPGAKYMHMGHGYHLGPAIRSTVKLSRRRASRASAEGRVVSELCRQYCTVLCTSVVVESPLVTGFQHPGTRDAWWWGVVFTFDATQTTVETEMLIVVC